MGIFNIKPYDTPVKNWFVYKKPTIYIAAELIESWKETKSYSW